VPRDSLKIIRDEHLTLGAVLQSIVMMIERGPKNNSDGFFDVLRAMLFYIDELPEKRHHPLESSLLFPLVRQRAPETSELISRLEKDHASGESAVRELQHLLLAWELIGETRRSMFEQAAKRYIAFYFEHMHLEETVILPAAQKVLSDADWRSLDEAFIQNRDPLSTQYPRDPVYDRLFTRIVNRAPAPIGAGDP
jgi:hemerythrin-like domain-containing protein